MFSKVMEFLHVLMSHSKKLFCIKIVFIFLPTQDKKLFNYKITFFYIESHV